MPSPSSTERLVNRHLSKPADLIVATGPINDGDRIRVDNEGSIFRLVIDVAEFTQAITTADLNFGRKIFEFAKAGRIKVLGARVSATITLSGAGTLVNGVVGVGTDQAAGAADTLTDAEENILDGANATFTAIGALGTEVVTGTDADKDAINATSAAASVYLNIGWDGGVAGTATISGTVEIIGVFIPVHD